MVEKEAMRPAVGIPKMSKNSHFCKKRGHETSGNNSKDLKNTKFCKNEATIPWGKTAKISGMAGWLGWAGWLAGWLVELAWSSIVFSIAVHFSL